MNIVILDSGTLSNDDIDFKVFNKFGNVKIYDYTAYEDVLERIENAEIILCTRTPITREIIINSPKLKYIGLFSTGFNSVDINAAKEHGIVVTNAPSYSTNAVAQHVFAFILDNYSKINFYNQSVKNGDWITSKHFSYFNEPIDEIREKTLGIIGFGSIGKKVYQIAKAFDMNVIVHTRSICDEYDKNIFKSFDDVIKNSDIITLHCPLTEKTKNIINTDSLSKMKSSAMLINTARGPLINEEDLYLALKNNLISKAYLDVINTEPMQKENKLIKQNNCIITPHIAWAPLKTRQNLILLVANNLDQFINGTPQNVIF